NRSVAVCLACAASCQAMTAWEVAAGPTVHRQGSRCARPAPPVCGVKKRAPAHARRWLKRKNGGFWSAQFCTETARRKRFELPPRISRLHSQPSKIGSFLGNIAAFFHVEAPGVDRPAAGGRTRILHDQDIAAGCRFGLA